MNNFWVRATNKVLLMGVGVMSPAVAAESEGIERGISGIAKIIHDHVGYGLPIAGTIIGVGMMAFGMMKHQYTVAGTGAAVTVLPAAFYKISSVGFGVLIP